MKKVTRSILSAHAETLLNRLNGFTALADQAEANMTLNREAAAAVQAELDEVLADLDAK